MITFPNCKINIGLNIVGKRSDGFHDIETVFYPLPWSDILEINRSGSKEQSVEFKSSGIRIYGSKDTNLCVRAYQLLAADHPIGPVRMQLHKLLPIGAGLGGGSADAAFVLKSLNQLFQLGISDDELEVYAGRLGSDCPFFIRNKPVFASGRGDVFEEVKIRLDEYYFVIVKPRIHVSTATAYAGVTPMQPVHPLKELIRKPVETWKEFIHNDFEKTVLEKHPTIRKIKKRLYEEGAVYASMSGSGSAVFGIFNRPIDLHMHFRNCTVWQGNSKPEKS